MIVSSFRLIENFVPNSLKFEGRPVYKSIRNLISGILLLVYFRGLFTYPLTDLYAAGFIFLAALVVYRVFDSKKFFAMLFFAGIFAYLAYNIRTIYLFSLSALSVVVIVNALKEKNIFSKIICVVSYFGGVLAASVPQILLNQKFHQVFSIFVNNGNLFVKQLFWGLTHVRYETYVGTIPQHNPGLKFIDMTGSKVLDLIGSEIGQSTITDYVKVFFRYPIECVSNYVKHICNVFFPIFPDMYIENLDANKYFLAGLALLINFIFIAAIFIKLK